MTTKDDVSETPRLSPFRVVQMVLGLWLIFSPFILGFSAHRAAMWNNIAVGLACLFLATGSKWEDGGYQALIVPIGIWLFMSPFVLGLSSAAFALNNIITAFVVIGWGLISEGWRSASPGAQQHGGS
jgi:hypothetical protein